jgi:hypothetical protein
MPLHWITDIFRGFYTAPIDLCSPYLIRTGLESGHGHLRGQKFAMEVAGGDSMRYAGIEMREMTG